MTRSKLLAKPDPVREVVQSFAINEEINQLLIEHLDPLAWRARTPGARTRTIAAIFAHMHHVRRKWIRLSAPHFKLPAELDRSCTQAQARKALAASGPLCAKMTEQMMTSSPGKAQMFLRDRWARAWPAGPMMVAYMIAHEAHHRGQICMLAHQLGFRLPGAATSSMWRWETLMKH